MPMLGRGRRRTIAERARDRKPVVQSRQPSGAVMAQLGISHVIREFEQGKDNGTSAQ